MDPRAMAGDEPYRRQLWNAVAATSTKPYEHCQPYTLPSLGVIEINPDFTVTLTANAVFTPECTSGAPSEATAGIGPGSAADMRDPFHASITPQAYATGAATVIAWMLVIMLLITPRTFFAGTGGRSGLMGRRGMISGASGGGSVIGVGTRPWLQKVATLTVAISLTLATADTFRIAERQYEAGYMDAMALRDEVVGGMEIKVSRVISDIFLWLAQVQTLIRLFPRHKEKVIIKWTGFALIMLDIAFSCLNSFMGSSAGRPRRFVDAIPALSYLFQLALSMLYAAWVMYYSITKRRYAFYHSMMWNITLIALLSFIAILTPVVFFITDISNYTVAGWGDYFRWVGAAAASVIVWEWVERIEALEREEKKDGILGREIFDGDEMLETTPTDDVHWPRNGRNDENDGSGGEKGLRGGVLASAFSGHGLSEMAHRLARTGQSKKDNVIVAPLGRKHAPPTMNEKQPSQTQTETGSATYAPVATPPPAIVSPISRTDTTSAASTVYTVRYHPVSDSPPNIGRIISADPEQTLNINTAVSPQRSSDPLIHDDQTETETEQIANERIRSRWQAVPNPFKRRRASPPPELQRGRVIDPLTVDDVSATIPPQKESRRGLKSRLGAFAAEQGDRIRERGNSRQVEPNLPVTIIPAQPRGRTWSPEILIQMGQSPTESSSTPIIPSQNVTGSTETAPSVALQTTSTENTSAPRIRFTPETWQKPSTRQSDLDRTLASSPPTSSRPAQGIFQRNPPSNDTLSP
ncbi:PalH-domain-containing protein [Mytilinidion resinicola]|uniref:PalH-domain-containing protein n=1 Tax=Mytilinidion resinicola TaxID=574789 RepID=A0A6A6YK53_9PEZI|nr:PalH-domain-containing protein [Mytilinidion resinicola]KAF2809232.1 PalH-domain-containing protein [Mytilinidion resinicola]